MLLGEMVRIWRMSRMSIESLTRGGAAYGIMKQSDTVLYVHALLRNSWMLVPIK
jgi:hypothetical protein